MRARYMPERRHLDPPVGTYPLSGDRRRVLLCSSRDSWMVDAMPPQICMGLLTGVGESYGEISETTERREASMG